MKLKINVVLTITIVDVLKVYIIQHLPQARLHWSPLYHSHTSLQLVKASKQELPDNKMVQVQCTYNGNEPLPLSMLSSSGSSLNSCYSCEILIPQRGQRGSFLIGKRSDEGQISTVFWQELDIA